MSPQTHERECQGVLAGEDIEGRRLIPRRTDDIHGLHDVATGILDANDVLYFREFDEGWRFDISTGPSRDIVNNQGKGSAAGNLLEMGNDARLSRFVVIGADLETRICPRLLCVTGHGYGFVGAIGTGSSYHWNPSLSLIDHDLDNMPMFFVVQCWGFAGCTTWDKAVHVFDLDKVIDQVSKPLFIDRKIIFERSHEGDMASTKILIFHDRSSLETKKPWI